MVVVSKTESSGEEKSSNFNLTINLNLIPYLIYVGNPHALGNLEVYIQYRGRYMII